MERWPCVGVQYRICRTWLPSMTVGRSRRFVRETLLLLALCVGYSWFQSITSIVNVLNTDGSRLTAAYDV